MNDLPGRDLPSRWLEIEPMAGRLHREPERDAPRERLDHIDIDGAVRRRRAMP